MEDQELLFYEREDYRIAVWYHEKDNCIRVYLNNHEYDLIYCDDTVVHFIPALPRFNISEKKEGEI